MLSRHAQDNSTVGVGTRDVRINGERGVVHNLLLFASTSETRWFYYGFEQTESRGGARQGAFFCFFIYVYTYICRPPRVPTFCRV